jgi:hypothetical protein
MLIDIDKIFQHGKQLNCSAKNAADMSENVENASISATP